MSNLITKNQIQNQWSAVFHRVPIRVLFFLIYVKDLPNTCQNFDVTMFADDTNFYGKIDDGGQQMSRTLSDVSSWMICNKLTVNKRKSKITHL